LQEQLRALKGTLLALNHKTASYRWPTDMTNWQDRIHHSIGSLGTGDGADFGYAYVERQDTKTYKVQSYGPLEEMELDFNSAIQRVIVVASQIAPPSS
jgi:hypothetical protein